MCIKGSVKTKPDYPIVNCRGRVCLPEDTKQTVFGRANLYNPQIEMFARFKMKSSFHKTKRII